jgi:hypothetical protein
MVLSALALLACASFADAGIVDPDNSSASIVGPVVRLRVTPGGDEGFIFPVNHQIDVVVRDSDGNPVEIVASDIWLLNVDTEPCPGGWIADSSTYAPNAGYTTFTGVPRGGVPITAYCRDTPTDVMAVGVSIHTFALAEGLHFVSPDLNGDGTVDSVDFALFASCYNIPCPGTSNHCYCADLDKSNEDPPGLCVGSVDFAIFAASYNQSDCP